MVKLLRTSIKLLLKDYNLFYLLPSGLADIVGRRFGTRKIPFNRNKSIVGSVAMASAGFLTSIG